MYKLTNINKKQHSRQNKDLAPFPPAFEAIPCKPLLFDLALNSLEFPTLKKQTNTTTTNTPTKTQTETPSKQQKQEQKPKEQPKQQQTPKETPKEPETPKEEEKKPAASGGFWGFFSRT